MHNFTAEDETVYLARARQNVVLSFLGLISNLTLIIVVVISVRLRRSTKYLLVASVSVADVMISLIYLPLDTLMAFDGGEWVHSCRLLFVTYGLHEFVVPNIASLTLSALCLEYSFTMFHSVSLRVKNTMVAVGILVPWLVGFSALVPVSAKRFLATSESFTVRCTDSHWTTSTVVILVGMFGYLPLALLTACLLVMLVSHWCRPPDHRLATRTIASRSQGVYLTHEIGDTVLACLIYFAFNLPFLLDFSLHIQCAGSSCHNPDRVQHGLEVLRTAESVFFPAVWMLGVEFRHGLFTSCKCCQILCDSDSVLT